MFLRYTNTLTYLLTYLVMKISGQFIHNFIVILQRTNKRGKHNIVRSVNYKHI